MSFRRSHGSSQPLIPADAETVVTGVLALAGALAEQKVRRHFDLADQLRLNIKATGLLGEKGPGYLGLNRSTMLRYLRARKFDLEKAQDMYIATLQWRRENDVDRFRREAAQPLPDPSLAAAAAEKQGGVDLRPEARLVAYVENEPYFQTYTSCLAAGFDLEGRPLYYERTGETSQHMGQLLKAVTKEEVIERHVRQQELAMARLEESEMERGHFVDGFFLVLDLHNLSAWPNSDTFDIFKQCVRIDEAYYPETMGRQWIVNAPRIFNGIWRLVRFWLDPNSRAKIAIHSHNADWRSELRRYIDVEQLVVDAGGSLLANVHHPGEDLSEGERRADELQVMIEKAASSNDDDPLQTCISDLSIGVIGEDPKMNGRRESRRLSRRPSLASMAHLPSANTRSLAPSPARKKGCSCCVVS
eukprot:Hpha_TRINITY_DN25975_c0_g1::TRINITY_DN25975_c0_g1_i1::g.185377::m.185377